MDRNECLRALCRSYLTKLRYLANKHGLGEWIEETIQQTKDPNCKPTEHEVMLLARSVNEERLQRTEVPEVLGKNYKKCVEENDFERVKKLKRVGIYSKVSTLLLKAKKE